MITQNEILESFDPETPKAGGQRERAGYVIYLPVSETTGEVCYDYIEYGLRSLEETKQEHFKLIDGWSFKEFKIVPNYT